MGSSRRHRPGSAWRAVLCGAFLTTLLLLGGASGAGAASLANVTLTNLSAVPSAGLDADDHDVTTALAEATACGAACSHFETRFAGAALAEADGYFEQGAVDFDWGYRVTLDVAAGASEAWSLAVDTRLLGALTLVDDAAGEATAELGGFSGTYTGPGSTSGSLALAGLGTLSGAGGGNQGVDAGEQSASFTVADGLGPATLQFEFQSSGRVESTCGGFWGCVFGARGDEAAVRLGETGTPPTDDQNGSFTAGSYPGPDGRARADDGHYARFELTAIPEPGSGLLVALGLLGVGAAGRRRRR